MNKKIFLIFVSIFFTFFHLKALKTEPLLNYNQKQSKIFINNRILAIINGEPISTYDLTKKLDITFYRTYPEFADSVEARYQYYMMAWKTGLEQLVEKKLILADAKENKIEVSPGDIRQEMEESFGPNIVINLEKAGISLEEAAKVMQEEITMRRMLGGRVHAKAIRNVTPSVLRKAYQEFLENPDNARLTQWQYQTITVKDRTQQRTEALAGSTYRLIMEGVPFDQLQSILKERLLLGRQGKITVSNFITHHEKELSKEYAQVLSSLDSGMVSQPFISKSRANSTFVCRILAVKERIEGGFPSFKEVEENIKEKLLNDAVDQESDTYMKKLYQYYHISLQEIMETLPSDYAPFILQ